MSLPEAVHESWVTGRRVRVLSAALAESISGGGSLLDVGCGDGRLAAELGRLCPGIEVRGIDVDVRPEVAVAVEPFDGERLPFEDRSFDTVMMVDVLHHTEDPLRLMRETARVSRKSVLLKDHLLSGPFASATLRFMDQVGNRRYGVPLPYNYWREDQWRAAFEQLGMRIETWTDRLGIYPWPMSVLFDRGLHFIARLSVGRETGEPVE
ncbi:MAG: class I SAM-dependent methyltransferase [Thermoanaerobaculia bacterium]